MTYVMQRNKDASKQRIDAINMSYGEYSHWSSSGRVGELMADVINNHGVVWMASAGNDGPVQQVIPILLKYLALIPIAATGLVYRWNTSRHCNQHCHRSWRLRLPGNDGCSVFQPRESTWNSVHMDFKR